MSRLVPNVTDHHMGHHHQDHHHLHHGDHGDHGGHSDHGMGHHGDSHHDNHGSAPGPDFPELPKDHQGLEKTTSKLSRTQRKFVDINNELGLRMYRRLVSLEEFKNTNFVFSPIGLSTALAMVFLGARGSTSWQINEFLKLDEMITFNPHLMYKEVTDALVKNQPSACVKQLFIDKVTLQTNLPNVE